MMATTDNNKNDSNSPEEEPETTAMENVSLEEDDYDVEKAKKSATKGGVTDNPKRRNIVVVGAVVVLACVTIGIVVALAVALGGSKTETTTSSASPAVATPEDSTTSQAAVTTNPFQDSTTLRGFSSDDIIEGYASVEEFEADLTKAAEFIVHNVIQWNIHNYGKTTNNMNDTDVETSAALGAGVAVMAASAAETTPTQQNSEPTQRKASLTNNQEQDADEADIVKSDGHYVFASYGNHLLVWDGEGNMITQVNMTIGSGSSLEENIMPESDDAGWGGDDWANDDWSSYHAPTDYILALLLTDDHVVVIAESYQSYDVYDDSASVAIFNRDQTRVLVYTKPSAQDDGMMTLVGSKYINGNYRDARWMQDSNSIQVLTGGGVGTWDFVEQLSVPHFPWMSKEDYTTAAAEKAKTVLIPEFVSAISHGLSVDGKLPAMLRLNGWTARNQTDAWRFADYSDGFDSFMREYIQVTSLDVDSFTKDNGGSPEASVAAFLAPYGSTKLYGTDDSLVVAFSRSEWDAELSHSSESTFLISMRIGAAGKAGFHSVAMLEGSMSSSYALDVLGNDLRVATTNPKWSALDNVWETCGDSYYHEDTCMNEGNWHDCFDAAMDCPRGKVVKTGCPYTFSCSAEGSSEEDISSTDNTVTVFDLSQRGNMVKLGSVTIGHPHETITAVRFGEDFSYAMTFDQTDPFYVLELQPGQAPVIRGSVTLDGFANYLHPLDEEQTLLVGIGQNTTGTGLNQANSGLLISVFDVSDPSNPIVVDSRMVVDPDEASSSSRAEWDFKSVTYEDGKLILPVSIYGNYDFYYDDDAMSWPSNHSMTATLQPTDEHAHQDNQDFQGFIVYGFGGGAITELFRVDHSSVSEWCHYCGASLPEKRSFLFEDGNLMTMYNYDVVSTDIASGKELWRMEPSVQGESAHCGCW